MTDKLLSGAETLEEAVGLSIGAASTCWENVFSAGVFDSTAAAEIVDELVAWIRDDQAKQRAGATWGSWADAIHVCQNCKKRTRNGVLRAVPDVLPVQTMGTTVIHMSVYCEECSAAMDAQAERETPITVNYKMPGISPTLDSDVVSDD